MMYDVGARARARGGGGVIGDEKHKWAHEFVAKNVDAKYSSWCRKTDGTGLREKG